ncbi:MAG: RsiV family protein [Lentimicrobiaceae bacterium]|nr:RsiV family protein [Lentimicrobiaceae bacterium]
MKKTLLILTTLALFSVGCNQAAKQKQTAETTLFNMENKVLNGEYADEACVINYKTYLYEGTMAKETAKSEEDITFSLSFPVINTIFINKKEVDLAEVNDYLLSLAMAPYDSDEKEYNNIEEMRKAFFDDYIHDKKETESSLPWNYDKKITVQSLTERGGNNLVFFKEIADAYFGGAHPVAHTNYYGYHLSEKRQVTLNDIITNKEKLNELGEKYFKEAFQLTNEPYKTQGYDFEKFELNDNFYLTNEGIFFFFNPYEITSYANHLDVDVFIPNSAIKSILK